MAKDLGDAIGSALGQVAREAAQTVSSNGKRGKGNPLSGPAGLAAGAGLVALAPLATKGAGKLVRGLTNGSPVKKAGDKLGGTVKDAVGETVEKAGGAGGLAKEAGKSMLPGVGGGDGGGGGGKSKGKPGVGKGRRMPIQQDIDIGVPIKQVYNEWTQFEQWPEFMHRLENVSQEDESHLSFKTKIWGISKEFKAEITEQTPEERIKWEVTEGVTHTGVVTFHELGPRLTRVEVNIDVQPGSLIEKAARGMRHVKRAVRADLARFKAYVLMEDEESGASGGRSEEGEAKGQSSSGSGGSSGSSNRRSGSSGRSSSSGRSASRSSRSSRSSGSSSGRTKASSSGRTKASSSGRTKGSSSGRTKASSSGSGSGSGRGRSSSSNGRSGSSRSRASSSNGSSGSGSRSSGRRKSSSGSRS